ncbi:hypothetical protein GCM10008018_05560 [Paenibacillus marchantiophytorum]|uniref:Ketopantoate hydroxymethyltransferase n=1 Tax=Paenibacillus marchantiophytorum TaxID=1619310 RepID=A0ABQ2BR23_9BACL|nr:MULTISPECIES: hypothetical protein [Paenibacillus]UKS24423.1 hypothetical protein LOZ80_22685 [Paenibacillus sp. HWE-109]GGI44129.1 hypothetical protein GCM10008018_05560 [Paenibacillus marchantiophytorum]
MRYQFCQYVTIVDMNEEILSEVLFEHGVFESNALSIGSSVVIYQLGLKQFDVVYDKREGKTVRSKVVDIEINLITQPTETRVYIEPVRLIVGQHDIGEVE